MEYIEAVVIEKVSEYIFDKNQIDDIFKSYQEYQSNLNTESVQLKNNFEQKIKSIDKSLDRVANAIMATDSETLYTKTSVLETEKKQLEFSLAKIENKENENSVSREDLKKAFSFTKELFRKGKVKNIKKLIELFIDYVIIYKEHIEIRVKIKPDIEGSPKIGQGKKSDFRGNVSNFVYTPKWM